MDNLLEEVIKRVERYLSKLSDRRVSPAPASVEGLKSLDVPLQENSIEPAAVLAELDEIGSVATVASAGNRYFGFVTGGALPATLAVNMLAGAWDQNGVLETASPVASFIEEVCQKWLNTVLGLPPQTAVGFVTGATMANFTGLAAARHALSGKIRRRATDSAHHKTHPGRRHLLVRRNEMAGTGCHADQRVVMGNNRKGRR
jgi:glutamate/tyrosine decarboxylase-like PLP-dependent enzyme